ncbi:MAG TPA: HAD-IIB family hydrolase, partial [Hypericibacter adhaerens]|uniref:HAD-IIB family hydrolase n=1 Tax=Hypericibacter adhaerens TaxID=2602016 RepID=UPI002CB31F2B
YDALERLKSAGLIVIPVTGRPAGWCDMIARFWPVDAVVGENGAFYFRYDAAARRMIRRYAKSDLERARDRKRLQELADAIPREVKGSAIASDQAYREADLAIDFCEDVAPLDAAEIDRIAELFRERGATAKISSIHVNGWFGDYDKLGMSRRLFQEVFAIDLDREREAFVYAGDSPNDQPMFAYFPHAVGVANVRDFTDRLKDKPRYVTPSRGGAGFAELAAALLAARAGS